ncbi:MAG: WG repeat-containing protein [Bacteroidales bacterium]|nr:WG repeat-containing protein [Bacteroidales bacterium]
MKTFDTTGKAFLPVALFIAIFMIGTEHSARSQDKVYTIADIGQHIDRAGVSEEILRNVEEIFFLDKDSRGKINDEANQLLLSQRDAWMEEHWNEYIEKLSFHPQFLADAEAPLDVLVQEFSNNTVRVSIVFSLGHSRWHQYSILLKDYSISRNETVDRIFRLKHLEEVYTATYKDIGNGSSFTDVLRTLGINYVEYAGQTPQYRNLFFPDHNLEVVLQDNQVKFIQQGRPAWADQLQPSGAATGEEEENLVGTFPYDHFDVSYIPELGFVAVDKKGNFLFEVLPYDNGPDYPSEGLIRIRENGKIGFADMEGNIRIPPAFTCADPFRDGVALICTDGVLTEEGEYSEWKEARWGAIDKEGNVIVEPFDGGLFTRDILELKLDLYRHFGGSVEVRIRPVKLDEIDIFLHGEGEGLFVDMRTYATGKQLLTYIFLPWQDLAFRSRPDPDAPIPTEQLVTVTPKLIVYLVDMAPMLSEGEMDTIADLAERMNQWLQIDACQQRISGEDGVSSPTGLRIISLTEYPYYLEVSVATPGSGLLLVDSVRMEFPGKMILLHQVPDMGPIHSIWIKPDLSLADRVSNPSHESQTFVTPTSAEDIFPDYEPKRTPDTMLDYMPSLLADLTMIPDASLDNLSDLINLFDTYNGKAEQHPGMWVDGNLILGAREKEYRPSPEELMLMEIGERIGTVISETDPEELKPVMKKLDRHQGKIEFKRFFFIHYDVMGSGRFFYIDGIEDVSFTL